LGPMFPLGPKIFFYFSSLGANVSLGAKNILLFFFPWGRCFPWAQKYVFIFLPLGPKLFLFFSSLEDFP